MASVTLEKSVEIDRLRARLRRVEKAETRLHERETRVAAALRAGQVGVFDFDPRSGRHHLDKTLHDLWGIPENEIVTYRTFFRGIHPDDRSRVMATVRAALDPVIRKPYGVEYRVIDRRDGKVRWLHSEGTVSFEDGIPVRLVGTAVDVTGRVEAEQAARGREARLRAVLNAAGLGSWHWNIRTNAVEMNRVYVEMLGYELDEVAQTFETFRHWLHPDDGARVQEAVRRHFSGEADRFNVEFRLRHKNGNWVWILSTGRLIERDERGRPLIMTGTHQDISARVEQRHALEESEARFRETFENAAVGIAHVGLDGRWLRVNNRLCNIVGYDRNELLATTFQDITHPDDLEDDLQRFRAMKHGEIPGYQIEKRYLTKSGETVWIQLTTALQRDRQGEPVYCISVVQDISGRKRAEEALQRSEERLAAALRGGKLGVYDYDPRNGELNWDHAVRHIWGIPNEEPVNYETFAAGVHPRDLPAVEEILDAALDPEQGKTFAAEYRVINRQTGEMRWVRAEGDVTFSDGIAARLVGTVYDITRQREAEDALRESEAQFRLLADNIHQLAWMTDAQGRVYWYNKRWLDYTGTTLEEVKGWGWRKVPHPDHVDRVLRTISRSFETGEPWEDTFPLRDRDGNYRWFLSRALPGRDEEGRIVRWFGTNTDITERLQADQHRDLLVRELNHRVKNTLAVVQGIAHQTFRSVEGRGADQARAFQQRLVTLAAAHDLLTRSNWEWTTLKDVVREAIRAVCAQHAPVRIKGPPIMLTPKQAITFSMALHELCTNAVKYGALSVPAGHVDIVWERPENSGGKCLRLLWREVGGPKMKRPRRRGFGSRMIENALARELNGMVRMDFRREGLICTIEGRLDDEGETP